VRITVDNGDGNEEKHLATKGKGEYFGEVALIKEDVRSANVYAVGIVQLG
jgi:CRP-like cAMP-binding protein